MVEYILYAVVFVLSFRFLYELSPNPIKNRISYYFSDIVSLFTEYLGKLLIGQPIYSMCIEFVDEHTTDNEKANDNPQENTEKIETIAQTLVGLLAFNSYDINEFKSIIQEMQNITQETTQKKYNKYKASMMVVYTRHPDLL